MLPGFNTFGKLERCSSKLKVLNFGPDIDAQFISKLIHVALYAPELKVLASHKNINTLV